MRSHRDKHSILASASAAIIAMLYAPFGAHAGTSTNANAAPTAQGSGIPAITISFSGQTAMRTFSNSLGITTLQPGGSISLNYTPYGGSTVTHYASLDEGGYVQLASKNFASADFGLGATSVATAPDTQQHSAIRLEWHEQGSVQGQIDLINDQVGYYTTDGGVTGFLSSLGTRGPSVANPTWINNTSFNGSSTSLNGHGLSTTNFANTYDTNVYDLATGRNKSSGSFGGINGQDRIQFAVGEYKTEGLRKSGTPSKSAIPGAAGYGQGNPALATSSNTTGLGVAGGRQQFYSEDIVNQATDKVDPQTGANYTSGPWNTAGAQNLDSKQIAVTAVTFSANPGTGLYRINKGDAQWLQTAGRLQNGADFNIVMRANDAGQRIIPAVNTGVDPSWAVGENDDGFTNGTAIANVQKTLGAGIRFSGKTSGTESRNAIAQSRLGIGGLSIAEARGAADAAPVRTLDVDFEHLTDTGNPNDFIRVNFDNIVNFTYKAVLVSHYNTIKSPRPDLLSSYLSSNPGATPTQVQNWWNGLSSAQTGIKGDPYGNVAAFINNITASTGTAAAGLTPASANNPADALFGAGFLIPGLLNYYREFDGGPLTPTNLNAAQLAVQNSVKNNYGPNFTADGSNGSNSQTIGTNAYYGALNAGNTGTLALNGGTSGLTITNNNYLFGNFNQDGRRDFASVKESVNAALSLHAVDGAANSIYTNDGGVSNTTTVPSLSGSPGWATSANRKGDLIILGDFNSDGRFNGNDIYLLARGASLSDNAATDHLATALGATFADAVRNPNAKLNKNAALDYIKAQTAGSDPNKVWLRTSAQNALQAANDPTGLNAFNKADINRDGLISRADAKLVDHFVGKDYHNLDDVLSAVVAKENGTVLDGVSAAGLDVVETPAPISLVDVELTDNGLITHVDPDGAGPLKSDFQIIREELTSTKLLDGDANFDGFVNVLDMYALATNWLGPANQWSDADFNFDGFVNATDLGLLGVNWLGGAAQLGETVAAFGLPSSAVPEPASIALLPLGLLISRRRRRG